MLWEKYLSLFFARITITYPYPNFHFKNQNLRFPEKVQRFVSIRSKENWQIWYWPKPMILNTFKSNLTFLKR